MKYPWLDSRDIESAASGLLLKSFGSGAAKSPCVDLGVIVYDYLCEKEQLSFSDERDLGWADGDQVLGRMKPLAGKIEITSALKRREEVGRYRFTVAHEIGHWVLHRRLFLAEADSLDLFGKRDDAAGLTSLNRNVFPNGSSGRVAPEEWQANRFAVELLIDPDLLRHEFVQRFDNQVVPWRSREWVNRSRSIRDHARLLATAKVRDRDSLHTLFGLSAEAMAIALEQRGYAIEDTPIL